MCERSEPHRLEGTQDGTIKGEGHTCAAFIEDGEHEALICLTSHPRDVGTESIRIAILPCNASL